MGLRALRHVRGVSHKVVIAYVIGKEVMFDSNILSQEIRKFGQVNIN